MLMLDCVCVIVLQVRSFIDGAYQRTVALLKENKELVEKMAQVRPVLPSTSTRCVDGQVQVTSRAAKLAGYVPQVAGGVGLVMGPAALTGFSLCILSAGIGFLR
jgi:hypothetical protein